MKWSWRIGRVAGIDIFVHATFLILLAWVALIHYEHRQQVVDALRGLLLIVTIFGVVVLHELGHALTARRFGIRTRDITLWPIGGVARLERMPKEPWQELLVALAGPAVNVVIAAACFAAIAVSEGVSSRLGLDVVQGTFLANLLVINVMLAVFNLLPAFPMDGGRVLRALLAMRLDYVQATQVAAGVGQGLAMLFGILGLFVANPFLIFIALFVWMGAAQEASMAQMEDALAGIPVERAMITEYQALHPADPLAVAIEHIMAGFQQDFPVVEDERVVGILTRSDLLAALASSGRETPVADVMQRDVETAEPDEMLDHVINRLQACECRSMPVVRDGRLVGIMTTDNLGEFLMIRAALRARRK